MIDIEKVEGFECVVRRYMVNIKSVDKILNKIVIEKVNKKYYAKRQMGRPRDTKRRIGYANYMIEVRRKVGVMEIVH